MIIARKTIFTYAVMLLVAFVAGSARADWAVGDDHKMHFPQLPDPIGWDVFASTNPDGTQKVLADDWQCSQTGPVTDVHIWGSWEQDRDAAITQICLSIHENIPEDPNNPESYSHPGPLLWERWFDPSQFTMLDYGTGEQGWYNPNTEVWSHPDHVKYHQINFEDIADPFHQEEGTIYWLDVTVQTVVADGGNWGWKTSQDNFMDDAVWMDTGYTNDVVGDFVNGTNSALGWHELLDPETGESLDLAFVITPEPATLSLLALGGLTLLRQRKRVG